MKIATQFKLRKLRKSDLPALIALDADVFGADTWPAQDFHDAFAEGGYWYGIKKDGELVGYIYFTIFKKFVEIPSICVSKSMQGRGLGKILMAKTIAIGRAAGCEGVLLEVSENNHGGRKFYDTFGFKYVSKSAPGYYHDGSPAIRLKLDISGDNCKRYNRRQISRSINALNSPKAA